MSVLEFTPAFGNRPTQLVGRSQVINEILDGLGTRPGSKERAVMMLGQRGYGKTVLLWELADRARESGYVVASPTSVREGMVERVLEKLLEDASRVTRQPKAQLTGGGVGAFGFSASLQFSRDAQAGSAEHRLTKACRELTKSGFGALFLIDEVQGNSPEVRRLVSTYQELIGEGLDVALVMAGLPASVSGALNDRVLTFLNRAKKVTLGPLVTGDIDAFYRRAFAAQGISISSELRREAASGAKGSPYLMQLIGHYIVRYAEGQDSVDEAALGEAMTSAQTDFQNDVCGTTLATLSPTDITYLRAMSELGGTCRSSDVAKCMGVTLDYAQQYRKRLLDAGVIIAPSKGIVKIDVPYLRDYLMRD